MPNIPFSAACERNKDPILAVISSYLSGADSVLEIGSGTGQHAVHFAQAFPKLVWQTSDQSHYLEGIRTKLDDANVGNVVYPIELNVNQSCWVEDGKCFDVIYSTNTLHIMTERDVLAFFQGLPQVTNVNSYLIVYGPFKYDGQFTSESNAQFDRSLRSRECGSSIKEFDEVNKLAQQQSFQLLEDQAMPANNQCLIWRRNN